MATLTTDEVKKIADLAMISLTDVELEKFAGQITSILDYVQKLSEVNTDEIDFKSHVELENVMRSDETQSSLSQDMAVSQTQNKDGYIVVPSVISDEE